MRNLSKIMFLSFVFLAIGLSTIATPVFGDKEKNQKLSPKTECAVDTDVKDHNKNTAIGPIDLQCNVTNSNIKDSTVISNSPSNGDTDSFKVVSTDPSDGDDNVPTELSDIGVTFNKNIAENSVDSASLALFADNCGNVLCNDPDIQDVSVSGKSATFSININDRLSPDTNYIASLLSNIQDEDGNSLDCANSKGVDDNCEWNFSTSGSTSNPTISLNPTSGTVATLVTVTGNGFDPTSTVVITFDGSTVTTLTSTSDGGFSTTFIVPISSSNGDHTVKATQGSNSASKTFTVTSSTTPIIVLDPTSGPVGTDVTIIGKGYAPSSTVTITFDGNIVNTNPAIVTTSPNGEFTATFSVPLSSNGDHTVKAAQGSNTASAPFTVTSSSNLTALSSPDLSENKIIPDIFG